jgi:hypothetical protein
MHRRSTERVLSVLAALGMTALVLIAVAAVRLSVSAPLSTAATLPSSVAAAPAKATQRDTSVPTASSLQPLQSQERAAPTL